MYLSEKVGFQKKTNNFAKEKDEERQKLEINERSQNYLKMKSKYRIYTIFIKREARKYCLLLLEDEVKNYHLS